MKKSWVIAGVVLLLAFASGTTLGVSKWGYFHGYPIVRVMVNGKAIATDVPAINVGGRTMVPLRFVSEALGADVAWDPIGYTALVSLTGSEPVVAEPSDYSFSIAPGKTVTGIQAVRVTGAHWDVPHESMLLLLKPESSVFNADGSDIAPGRHVYTHANDRFIAKETYRWGYPDGPAQYRTQTATNLTIRNIMQSYSIAPELGEVAIVNGGFDAAFEVLFEKTGRYEVWAVKDYASLSHPTDESVVMARLAAIEVALSDAPHAQVRPDMIEDGWLAPTEPNVYSTGLNLSGYGFDDSYPVRVEYGPVDSSVRTFLALIAPHRSQFAIGYSESSFTSPVTPGLYAIYFSQPGRSTSAYFTVMPKTTRTVSVWPNPQMSTTPIMSLGAPISIRARGFWPDKVTEIRVADSEPTITVSDTGTRYINYNVNWLFTVTTDSQGGFDFTVPSEKIAPRGSYLVEVVQRGRDSVTAGFMVDIR